MNALRELLSLSLLSRSRDSQGTPAKIMMHRLIQNAVVDQLTEPDTTLAFDTARVAFQRATEFIRSVVPNTAVIKGSSTEELLQAEWIFVHVESLARRYVELQLGVLPADLDWIALFIDGAGCAARLGKWQELKRPLAVASSILKELNGNDDNGLDAGRLGELQQKAKVIQAFVIEWGF